MKFEVGGVEYLRLGVAPWRPFKAVPYAPTFGGVTWGRRCMHVTREWHSWLGSHHRAEIWDLLASIRDQPSNGVPFSGGHPQAHRTGGSAWGVPVKS